MAQGRAIRRARAERANGEGELRVRTATTLVSLAMFVGLGSAAAASPAGVESEGPARDTVPTEPEAALQLLHRATFGPGPGDLEELLRLGRDAWLDRQLHPERIDDRALRGRLERFPAAGMTTAELYASYPPPNALRGRTDGDSTGPEDLQRIRREMGVQGPGRILFDLTGAKLQRAVYSERQLEEVMTDFWFNHFNVFFAKGADRWLIADYEREAIRPHVFGSFEEMLVATASHPAMLVYLDNWQSSVPDSLNPALTELREGRRRWESLGPRQRDRMLRSGRVPRERLERMQETSRRTRDRNSGINENYARELVELHTLGVDGGYTQEDVMELARAFTGWTITRPGRPGQEASMSGSAMDISFIYRPFMHYPGQKTVLGVELDARGREEGLEILRTLAKHPATARHIATKLVRAFVADEPPPRVVEELAGVFLETGGDLREVTRALFTSEEFYDPAHYGAKLKSPFELVASALRVTGAEVGPSRRLFGELRAFDHLPYMSIVPTGYPETGEDWTSSGALLQRMNFGLALAAGRFDNVHVTEFVGGADDRRAFVHRMLERLLPEVDTERLTETILEDLEGRSAAGARALGLALGSPEFQKH